MESKTRSKRTSFLRSRKRSEIDIIANILSEANKGTKKTRIMYRCNLSHKQLQVYLKLLIDIKFLMTSQKKEDPKMNFFRTTSKGFEFLTTYRTLKGLMT